MMERPSARLRASSWCDRRICAITRTRAGRGGEGGGMVEWEVKRKGRVRKIGDKKRRIYRFVS